MDDVRYFINAARADLGWSEGWLDKYDKDMAGIYLEETILRCQDALRYLEKGEGNGDNSNRP